MKALNFRLEMDDGREEGIYNGDAGTSLIGRADPLPLTFPTFHPPSLLLSLSPSLLLSICLSFFLMVTLIPFNSVQFSVRYGHVITNIFIY